MILTFIDAVSGTKGMKKLEVRLTKTDTIGLFRDSRGDVRTLAKALNMEVVETPFPG